MKKLCLEDDAWGLATCYASFKHSEVKMLVLGIKGALNDASIITGVEDEGEPLKRIEVRHPSKSDGLYVL